MKNNSYFRTLLNSAHSTAVAEVNPEKAAAEKREAERRKSQRIKKKVERSKRWKDRQKKLNDDKARREEEQSKYRDRFKELQDGTNPDYVDSEINFEEMDYETSKYLGGDVQHTHMVKGLDFILLNRKRQEIEGVEDENLEEAYEEAHEEAKEVKKKAPQMQEKEREFKSKMARRIHELLIEKAAEEEENHAPCQKFLPGRMIFEFDVARNSRLVPTPILFSKDDITQKDEKIFSMAIPRRAFEKIRLQSRSFRDGKNRSKRKIKKRKRNVKTEAVKDVGGDIFDDDGREYVPSKTAEGARKKRKGIFLDPTGSTRPDVAEADAMLTKVVKKARLRASMKEEPAKPKESAMRKKAATDTKRNGLSLKKRAGVSFGVATEYGQEQEQASKGYYAPKYYDSSDDERGADSDDEKPKKKATKHVVSRKSRIKMEEARLRREADGILKSYSSRMK